MKIKLAFICLLLISGIVGFLLINPEGNAQTSPTTISGKFYKFDVVAMQGQDSFTNFAEPSLNDTGTIAFTAGRIENGGVFLRRANGPITELTSALSHIGRYVQINNSDQVVAGVPVNAPQRTDIYRLDGNNPGTLSPIAVYNENNFLVELGSETGQSINNLNQASFTGRRIGTDEAFSNRIMSGISPGVSESQSFLQSTPPLYTSLLTMVADNGRIVAKAGFTPTDPIRLYEYNLTTFTDLAVVSPTTFNSLGRSPGISDDGEVVVFAGILNQAGPTPNYNNVYNTTSGPGIFAVMDIGQPTQRIVRLANRYVEQNRLSGGNNDGVCDQPEFPALCQAGELGVDAANNPLFLNSFNIDSRVAVIHQSLGVAGLQEDTIVVSFTSHAKCRKSAACNLLK